MTLESALTSIVEKLTPSDQHVERLPNGKLAMVRPKHKKSLAMEASSMQAEASPIRKPSTPRHSITKHASRRVSSTPRRAKEHHSSGRRRTSHKHTSPSPEIKKQPPYSEIPAPYYPAFPPQPFALHPAGMMPQQQQQHNIPPPGLIYHYPQIPSYPYPGYAQIPGYLPGPWNPNPYLNPAAPQTANPPNDSPQNPKPVHVCSPQTVNPSNDSPQNPKPAHVCPAQVTAPLAAGLPIQAPVQTSIDQTVHICVNCRRVRSHRYQHQNPLKLGDVPPPAFCHRCQADDSCTEDGSHLTPTKKSKSKNKEEPKKKKRRAKQYKSSDSDELEADVSIDLTPEKLRSSNRKSLKQKQRPLAAAIDVPAEPERGRRRERETERQKQKQKAPEPASNKKSSAVYATAQIQTAHLRDQTTQTSVLGENYMRPLSPRSEILKAQALEEIHRLGSEIPDYSLSPMTPPAQMFPIGKEQIVVNAAAEDTTQRFLGARPSFSIPRRRERSRSGIHPPNLFSEPSSLQEGSVKAVTTYFNERSSRVPPEVGPIAPGEVVEVTDHFTGSLSQEETRRSSRSQNVKTTAGGKRKLSPEEVLARYSMHLDPNTAEGERKLSPEEYKEVLAKYNVHLGPDIDLLKSGLKLCSRSGRASIKEPSQLSPLIPTDESELINTPPRTSAFIHGMTNAEDFSRRPSVTRSEGRKSSGSRASKLQYQDFEPTMPAIPDREEDNFHSAGRSRKSVDSKTGSASKKGHRGSIGDKSHVTEENTEQIVYRRSQRGPAGPRVPSAPVGLGLPLAMIGETSKLVNSPQLGLTSLRHESPDLASEKSSNFQSCFVRSATDSGTEIIRDNTIGPEGSIYMPTPELSNRSNLSSAKSASRRHVFGSPEKKDVHKRMSRRRQESSSAQSSTIPGFEEAKQKLKKLQGDKSSQVSSSPPIMDEHGSPEKKDDDKDLKSRHRQKTITAHSSTVTGFEADKQTLKDLQGEKSSRVSFSRSVMDENGQVHMRGGCTRKASEGSATTVMRYKYPPGTEPFPPFEDRAEGDKRSKSGSIISHGSKGKGKEAKGMTSESGRAQQGAMNPPAPSLNPQTATGTEVALCAPSPLPDHSQRARRATIDDTQALPKGIPTPKLTGSTSGIPTPKLAGSTPGIGWLDQSLTDFQPVQQMTPRMQKRKATVFQGANIILDDVVSAGSWGDETEVAVRGRKKNVFYSPDKL